MPRAVHLAWLRRSLVGSAACGATVECRAGQPTARAARDVLCGLHCISSMEAVWHAVRRGGQTAGSGDTKKLALHES